MTLNAWTGNPDADSYSQNNKPKCTAADGKTEAHNLPGVGLVVSAAAFNALVRDAEELAFLKNDLLSWVDHAVEKGNANSDIQEASERYDQWLKTRHAAMQEKQS